MKNKLIPIIIVIVIIILLLFIELLPSNAPETIYIRVLKPDKKMPEENAYCKADIITTKQRIEDKTLEKVEDMELDCYTDECINEQNNKGFYKLETGLKNYKGKFEIKIVCITKETVSYTILNNTHIPCEVTNNGKNVRCPGLQTGDEG